MQTLDDVVRSVIQDKMNASELFTALDVSNKVKETMPSARHREVRDLVRGMFTTDMSTAGWARTPITVTLADGSTTEALLYHPLADSWDLDAKYDDQKRVQSASKSSSSVVPATVAANGTVTVTPSVAPVAVSVAPAVAQAQAKDLWAQMFNSQPSLFPRK